LSLSQERSAHLKNAELLSSSESGIAKKLSNIASVYSQVLPEIPSAIGQQLKHDIQEKPAATALRLAESAAIGFGTAVLLAKSPVLCKTLLTGAGIGSTAMMLGSGAIYTKDAMFANSKFEQEKLAQSGIQSSAKLSAALIENTPALLLGASGGAMLTSRVAALDTIASSTRNLAEYKIRGVVPEGLHYVGLDAKTLKNVGGAGELNLYNASEEMLARTPWRGVEEGRFFKVASENSIKISERLPGERLEVVMGRRSQQMFHTHESEILPSSGDFTSVYGTGVVGVPKQGTLTFYEGVGKEAQEAAALLKGSHSEYATAAIEALQRRTYTTVVVEPSKQLAMRVDMRWDALENRMAAHEVSPLSFADTVKKLSKWDGHFVPGAIESSPEALLKPGMKELISKIKLDGF
ncbi:MAG: hypothetical protein K2X81_21415, partial [Candidatus Obscuribacterales bacterium]|nr:hypothetical protein [Candidatus Obscuribacterales bacterium]